MRDDSERTAQVEILKAPKTSYLATPSCESLKQFTLSRNMSTFDETSSTLNAQLEKIVKVKNAIKEDIEDSELSSTTIAESYCVKTAQFGNSLIKNLKGSNPRRIFPSHLKVN